MSGNNRSRNHSRLTQLEDRLAPALATWDGRGANNNWTTAANWVGDLAPQAGDDLVFPAAGQFSNLANDFAPGTGFRSIMLGNDFQLGGNSVTISSGISVGAQSNPTISLDLILGADQSFSQGDSSFGFTITGNIDLNGHVLTVNKGSAAPGGPIIPPPPSRFTLSGTIHGAGRLIKEGVGDVVLGGDNTYTGVTDVRAGALYYTTNNAGGAAGAGNGTLVGPEAALNVGISQQVTIPEPITFAPIGATNQYQLLSFADLSGLLVPNTFTGLITLTGLTRWQADDMIVANGLSGTGSLTITSGGLKFGTGSVNTFTGQMVNNPRLVLDGTGPFSPLSLSSQSGDIATVSGTGTIGPLASAGIFRITPGESNFVPGDSGIGTLTTGNLNSAGTLEIQVGAAGADKVAVHGSVQLSGSLRVLAEAGFTPSAGARFRIIDNDGSDPVIGTFAGLNEGTVAAIVGGRALSITYHGGDGNDVELVDAGPVGSPSFAVAAGPGAEPRVNVYDANGRLVRSFLAYDAAFHGGVHVVTGDVTGDGVPDVVTAPGPGGGPIIRVFNLVTGAMERQWLAYDPAFTGGVYVALGHFFGGGGGIHVQVVTGAGTGGGPHVKIFDLQTIDPPSVDEQWMAYDPNFRGGVTVAAADLNHDGIAEVITGAGPGGGPHVRTFETGIGPPAPLVQFMAYAPSFTGGVFVAAGDLDGDGRAEIITSPGIGGGPHIQVFNGQSGASIASFLAYDPNFRGGATVATTDLDGDGRAEILTGAGPRGGPHVKAFSHVTVGPPTVDLSFLAFDSAFTGGVFVG